MTHCDCIQKLSRDIYSFLTEIFKYKLSFSELGLTDFLVFHLVYNSDIFKLTNVEIYKCPWTIESVYGNDIDLFVENKSGCFNWYALQAKVMSYNGSFKDLIFKSRRKIQQWDKLTNHESTYGSKSYYLLYIGEYINQPFVAPTRKDCLGTPNMQELGLGIVESHRINSIMNTKPQKSKKIHFTDVFPQDLDSIRKLFCCVDLLPPSTKQFRKDQIDLKNYNRIYTNTEKNEEVNSNKSKKLSDGSAPIRIIKSLNEKKPPRTLSRIY